MEKERLHLPKFNIFCSLCQRGLGWTQDASRKENRNTEKEKERERENNYEYDDYSPDYSDNDSNNSNKKEIGNSKTVYCFSEVTYNVSDFQDFNNDNLDNCSNFSE